MNIFFDAEFTGLHKDTSLVSIAMVTEDGDKFYAEVVDYDRSQLNTWLNENVINNLWSVKKTIGQCCAIDYYHVGTKRQIAKYLKAWLSQFDHVQLVSDVAHYDMVLLIDLFGGAFDLPDNVSPACYDINQDIARFFNVTPKEAFDMNRECILGICDTGDNKHNALYDAEIIRGIYKLINN